MTSRPNDEPRLPKLAPAPEGVAPDLDDSPIEPWATHDPGPVRRLLGRCVRAAAHVWGWVTLPVAVLLENEDRRLRHLLQAAPAAAAVLAGGAAILAVGARSADLQQSYREAAAAAAEKEPEEARVCLERLCSLSDDPEYRYHLALAYDRLGDRRRARGLMERVARDAGAGLPAAHVWLADRLLAEPASWTPERLASAHRHLLLAGRNSDSPSVHVMLTRFYVALRDQKEAAEHLARAAKSDPRLNLDLAVLYERAGLPESARFAASLAEAEYRREVDRRPEDHEARVRWAVCLTGLGRFDEAIAALDRGRRYWPDGRYDELLARAYVGRYEALTAAGAPPAERIAALAEALRFGPKSEPALLRLVEFAEDPAAASAEAGAKDPGETETDLTHAGGTDVDAAGPVADARRILEGLLASGDAPAAVHLALGVRAWDANDEARCLWHLERAYALDPSLVAAGNNVAWLLLERPEPDLGRAERVIEAVVAARPDVPEFRNTRGQVRAKLGRWEEAADDLERAVAGGLRDNARTRRALAEAYRRTGKADLAALHEAEADRAEARRAAGGKGATEAAAASGPARGRPG